MIVNPAYLRSDSDEAQEPQKHEKAHPQTLPTLGLILTFPWAIDLIAMNMNPAYLRSDSDADGTKGSHEAKMEPCLP